ncbi:MAG: hypothetical protein R6X27_04045 [Candidatus Desulfacyla sp.]
MKKVIGCLMLVFLSVAGPVMAGDFLGVPVRSGGQPVREETSLLELRYHLPQEEIIQFYRDALKDQEDLVYKDRGESLEIEDHGKRAWHKIVIETTEKGELAVTITKDSWTWIMGTLAIRFVGVFVVLLIVYLGMGASTWIITRSIKAMEAKGGGKA